MPRFCESRIPLITVVMVVLAPFGRAVHAHETDCEHTHERPFTTGVITCDEPDADCGERLICKNQQNRTSGWCGCIRTNKGSCSLLAVEQLDPGDGGSPDAGEVITYLAVASPLNVGDIITDDDEVVAEYGPGDAHLAGSVTLAYGDFADPLAVPVTILCMEFTLPGGVVNGMPTGTHLVHLSDDDPLPALIYDSNLGTINTEGPEGIEVIVDTDLAQGLPTKLNLECRLEPNGVMLALVQGVQNFPCPSDFDDNGAVGFADLSAMLGAWGPCAGCPEDLTGDGSVGFADLSELLADWGPCP